MPLNRCGKNRTGGPHANRQRGHALEEFPNIKKKKSLIHIAYDYFSFVDYVLFELFEFLGRFDQNADFVHHVFRGDGRIFEHDQPFLLVFLHPRVVVVGTVPVTGVSL